MTVHGPGAASPSAPVEGAGPSPPVLDPVLLRTFVAVAEAGTVTEAARCLRLVQSALTRHLQRLQRELGLALFAPAGARLRLTPAGHAWLPVARGVLDAHAHARQAAAVLAAGRLTELAVGAPGTTLIDVVVPFLTVLGPEDPAVRVAETQLDDSLLQSVAQHDLVVLPSTPPAPGTSWRRTRAGWPRPWRPTALRWRWSPRTPPSGCGPCGSGLAPRRSGSTYTRCGVTTTSPRTRLRPWPTGCGPSSGSATRRTATPAPREAGPASSVR